MAKNIDIGGRLHSTATGNIVTGANEIFDDSKNKKQSVINAEVDAAIEDRYTKEETYNKNELNSLITTPNIQYVSVSATEQTTAVTDVLPATGAADTIYRVGNWDGTQYNDSVFSEYAWNGSAYIKLNTKSQIGEVYNISANHADTKYADLAAALGTNGTNIPQSLRKGGMSVKFVQSSDNKYVQYRLTSQSFNITPANWQKLGTEVSVSQNTETGHVDITVGNNTIPVPSIRDIDSKVTQTFNGNNNTSVGGDAIDVDGVDVVEIVPQQLTWSQDNVNNGSYVFFVNKSNDGTTWSGTSIGQVKGSTLESKYTIEPDGTYKYIRIGIRADVGETLTFDIFVGKGLQQQINETNEDLSELSDVVSGNSTQIAGILSKLGNFEKSEFLANGIANSTIGGVIAESITGDFVHATARCVTREIFEILGSGGGSLQLWCTTDSRGVVKRNSGANVTATEPIYITIQEGESFIIVNSRIAANKVLQRTSIDNYARGIYNQYRKENNGDIKIFPLHGIINSDGTFSHSSVFEATNFLYLGSEDTLSYKVYAISNMGGIFCYDKYKKFIDVYNTGIVLGTNYIEGNVAQTSLPAGTTYVRVFKLKDDDGYIYGASDESILIDSADTIVCPNNSIYPESYHKLGSNVNLNTAISDLHNMGGGVIKLLYWNTNGDAITMNYNDVSLVGLSPEYTKIGTAANTGSIVVGDGVTANVSNIKFTAMYKCKKNSKLILKNVVIEHPFVSIGTVYYNGEAPSVYYICSSDSSNKPKFFEEINTSNDAGAAINTALNNYTEVYLAIGTYNTTTTIKLNSNNLLSSASLTYRATINRQQAGNFCIMTNNNVTNTTVRRLHCNSFIRLDMNNSFNGHLIDCVFNGNRVAKDVTVAQKGLNIIRVGAEYNANLTMQGIVELLTYPYRVVYDDNSVKYRIEVYGRSAESNAHSVNFNDTIEIEGMTDDAELAFTLNYNQSALSFSDREGEENHSVVKNLKLSMYGTYGGYQYAVLSVNGNFLRFENLEIRNYHDCATQRTADDINNAPNTVVDGDRKHGVLVSINQYDNDCHTEFHNVKAYGSPYGFKNCRGFYVMRGSPKFYNCVGVGGGYGRYGYGWVLHHASKPYMYNCIGIGSPYGWGLNNGIQFQMNTEALLFNCIGIGNTNKQRYSNGNKAIVQLNTLSEASHGYCSYMPVHPILMDCIGYAADVDGSYAFAVGYDSKPQIEGGYYGKEIKTICNKVVLTDSSTSQLIDVGNTLYSVELKDIGFRETLANLPSGQKVVIKVDGTIICEATESVQQQYPPISNPIVPAGSVVTCEVVDSNDNPVSNANLNFDVIVRYMGHNQMTSIYIENSAHPKIRHATLSGNSLADGLHINCPDTADYLIDECTIDVPPTNYAIKSSSQRAVKVVNCVMTSGNVQNVTFAQTTTLGSNVVI